MLLITVATEKEIKPLEQFLAEAPKVKFLVTGMGPVATAASFSSYLTLHNSGIDAVLNIGVAGAYTAAGLSILDICLAQQEFLGDFGICGQDGIENFDPALVNPHGLLLSDKTLVRGCGKILKDHKIRFAEANFVTVNCCTGSEKRGEFLREKFAAGCENMEGAAVAMVCNNFNIPWFEMRCISNMVEDRNSANWQLDEAIAKICLITELVVNEYTRNGLPRI